MIAHLVAGGGAKQARAATFPSYSGMASRYMAQWWLACLADCMCGCTTAVCLHTAKRRALTRAR
eukprot:10929553-Alexandrium_andersonii.AAC.1